MAELVKELNNDDTERLISNPFNNLAQSIEGKKNPSNFEFSRSFSFKTSNTHCFNSIFMDVAKNYIMSG